MINLAVIEIKDIIKYLVKFTITITVIILFTRYFFIFGTKIKNQTKTIRQQNFLSCIETAIPTVKYVNNYESNNAKQPLKDLLVVELGMINSVEKTDKMEQIDNSVSNEKDNIKEEEELVEAEIGLETEVQDSNVPQKYTTTYNTVKIRNETDIKLTKAILTPNVDINMKNILIYHTHSCECYTPTEKYTYKKSGNFRTLNKQRSVIRVGEELKKYMLNYGYNVIHDTTLYDYPSYNASYDRSYDSVAKLLDKNKETEVLFDIHRDAIGDSTYAPTVKIGDEYVAQLMFVIGSNGGGSQHDNWQQNLKFAVKIQEKANELYPGLFKPIILRNSRYNQQLANGASIIEVGATGNTLEEAMLSMKYLAKVLSEL